MYHIIINPHSRSGQAAVIGDHIEEILKEREVAYTAHRTTAPGDATRFAEEITRSAEDARGITGIIVLGGDGTLDEVVNGLHLEARVPVGYIPTGSGNDFARGNGLPTVPEEGLKRILASQQTKELDIGVLVCDEDPATRHRFVVSAGTGYDAAVCVQTFRDKAKVWLNKIHLGKLSYVKIGVQEIVGLKPTDAELCYREDASSEIVRLPLRQMAFTSAHILPYEGGGFAFAPKADPTDGKLDLCVVEESSSLKIVPVLLSSMWKGHEKRKGVHAIRCTEAWLTLENALPAHTDGELRGTPKKDHYFVENGKLLLIV